MPTGVKVDEERKQRLLKMILVDKVSAAEVSKQYNVSAKTLYRWKAEKEKSMQEGQTKTEEAPSEAPAEPQQPADQPTQQEDAVQAARDELAKVVDEAKTEVQKLVEEAKQAVSDHFETVKASVEKALFPEPSKAQQPDQPQDQAVEPDQPAAANNAVASTTDTPCPNPSCETGKLDASGTCADCGFAQSKTVNAFTM